MKCMYRMWSSLFLGSESEGGRQPNYPVARGRQGQEVGRAEIRARSRVDLRVESGVLGPGVKISSRHCQLHAVTAERAHPRIRRHHAEGQLAQLGERSVLDI